MLGIAAFLCSARHNSWAKTRKLCRGWKNHIDALALCDLFNVVKRDRFFLIIMFGLLPCLGACVAVARRSVSSGESSCWSSQCSVFLSSCVCVFCGWDYLIVNIEFHHWLLGSVSVDKVQLQLYWEIRHQIFNKIEKIELPFVCTYRVYGFILFRLYIFWDVLLLSINLVTLYPDMLLWDAMKWNYQVVTHTSRVWGTKNCSFQRSVVCLNNLLLKYYLCIRTRLPSSAL